MTKTYEGMEDDLAKAEEPKVIDVDANPYKEADTDSSLDAAEDEEPTNPEGDEDHEPEGEPTGDGDEEAGEDEPAPILP